jgi:hypothetical protein
MGPDGREHGLLHLVFSPGVPALAQPHLLGMVHSVLTHGPAQDPNPPTPVPQTAVRSTAAQPTYVRPKPSK